MQVPAHGTRTVSEADFARMKLLDEAAAASHSDADLTALATKMISPADPAKDGADDEENPFVPAGYTYLAQFVDHDLTFDTHSVFDDPKSLERASNMRTPRFDLDNVYGRGPDDQPYLFQDTFDGTMLLGDALDNGVKDVQRNSEGRAIIGDPRNDENAIVVQLQSAFIRFHNKMVQRAVANGMSGRASFLWAQTQTRQHYQRILLDDFLPRIMDPTASTVAPIFSALGNSHPPTLRLYDLNRPPYMPIEFSVAAYRFGHSMIRPGYRLSVAPGDVALPDGPPDNKRLFSIFEGEFGGLRGFQRLAKGKCVDWSLFFAKGLAAGARLDNKDGAPNNAKGIKRTQLAYKIDTMVVTPLGTLPHAVAFNPSSLALRNLMRGRDFGLPSGQAAAINVGAPVLSEDALSVRVANDFANRLPIKSISAHFANNAPLWFYILAEAEQEVFNGLKATPPKDPIELGSRLGPLGGAIVLETFVGLMMKDPESVLNPRATWRSINGKTTFSMEELFAEIGAPLV